VCRVCGNSNLESILDLGTQYLTGVFPSPEQAGQVESGPLELVLCSGTSACGLVQLRHSFPADKMYGDSYGYRSGLNPTMVSHLRKISERAKSLVRFDVGDIVIDIGSNDGTMLGFFDSSLKLIGIDPSANKFQRFYREDIIRIPNFFSAEQIQPHMQQDRAKLITSIAMMYDLEDPISFASQVAACLDENGIWIFEQSYLPTMIERLAYDTVCHEHIEYYGVKQLIWILQEAGMKIIDLMFSDSNGGSVAVTATHMSSKMPSNERQIIESINFETSRGYSSHATFKDFAEKVEKNREDVRNFLRGWKSDGLKVAGLGASTKGNVLLQYIGATTSEISFIGDINPDKHGKVTPGTEIPIISEESCLDSDPDVLIVLPWHFSTFFENAPRFKGRRLFFPLPVPRIFIP
jgi:NDP-4-keto-2,6-dideoxyhexose 3-C-methyltransferase